MALDRVFELDDVRVEPHNGRVLKDGQAVELEPKVMALLCLLAETPGDAVSKDTIFARLWPDVTVNDDALSRTVWKLRQALGDDARAPRFVATVPKRGYRLLVSPVSAGSERSPPGPDRRAFWAWGAVAAGLLLLALVWIWPGQSTPPDEQAGVSTLIDRADAFYYQFTEADNAAAARLYQQALEANAASAPARAGLANTLTQQVIRWSPGDWPEVELNSRIRTALENGRTQTPDAQARLDEARRQAEAAIAADPDYPLAYRALGLVLSAQGEIDAALESYTRAVTLDPDGWESFINLADLHAHRGEADLSLAHMERAFEAMSRVYESQTVLVRPWYSGTGLSVARGYVQRGDAATAEIWFRRVLQWDPLNADALTGLSAVLRQRGDEASAREVCAPLANDAERTACISGG